MARFKDPTPIVCITSMYSPMKFNSLLTQMKTEEYFKFPLLFYC